MAEFTTLIEGLAFTECPRWREGRLYFSDQHTHRVFAITLDGKFEVLAEVAGKPSGLGFLEFCGAVWMAGSRPTPTCRTWPRGI